MEKQPLGDHGQTEVPTWILGQANPIDLAVLITINEAEDHCISVADIGTRAGVSTRTVSTSLKRLEGRGWLTREATTDKGGAKGPNRYILKNWAPSNFTQPSRHVPIPLAQAQDIAVRVMHRLEPHCETISIAGSIRRSRPTIGDIEIVCVPTPYDASPPFASGLATVVNQWPTVRGKLPCRYTQRMLPDGIPLYLFMVHPDGYGLQRAIRTGSVEWCCTVLAPAWVRAGYHSMDGLLRRTDGTVVPCRTEPELFDRIGLKWVHPRDREVNR